MPRGRKPRSVKNTKPAAAAAAAKEEDIDVSEGENKSDHEEETTDDIGNQDTDEGSSKKLTSLKPCQKIMIVSKEIETIGWNNVKLVHVLHPKTEQKTLFLINVSGNAKSDNLIFEIMTMEQESRSWFVDDSVITDGNIYVATAVDPLFFAVAAMKKSDMTMRLRDHFYRASGKNGQVERLMISCLERSSEMENVAQKIEIDEEIIAFKYAEDRTLEWLSKKVDKISMFLQKRGISSSEAAVSANFAKSETSSDKVEDEFVRYACDIVSEYVDCDLKKRLYEKYKLPLAQSKASKRKGIENETENGQSKKMKTDVDGSGVVKPTEDYGSSNAATANVLNTKLKAKDKELQKAAKGSQSLFKFFTPKAK